MRSRYDYLAGRLRQLHLNQGELGLKLQPPLSNQAISHRFRDRTPWSITEMYQVLEILGEPPEELHKYFPPALQKAKKGWPAA